VNDQNGRSTRLRHTATGALAALAAAGAIAGTAALAAKPHHTTDRYHAAADRGATKTPTSPGPSKARTPQPPVNPQPALSAIGQLADNGTITAAQGQALGSEIRTGGIDPDTLASSGFSPSQIQAIQQALENAKRAMVRTRPSASK
jgi:hypothetical protein